MKTTGKIIFIRDRTILNLEFRGGLNQGQQDHRNMHIFEQLLRARVSRQNEQQKLSTRERYVWDGHTRHTVNCCLYAFGLYNFVNGFGWGHYTEGLKSGRAKKQNEKKKSFPNKITAVLTN